MEISKVVVKFGPWDAREDRLHARSSGRFDAHASERDAQFSTVINSPRLPVCWVVSIAHMKGEHKVARNLRQGRRIVVTARRQYGLRRRLLDGDMGVLVGEMHDIGRARAAMWKEIHF